MTIEQILGLALSTLKSMGLMPFIQAGVVISLVIGFLYAVSNKK